MDYKLPLINPHKRVLKSLQWLETTNSIETNAFKYFQFNRCNLSRNNLSKHLSNFIISANVANIGMVLIGSF